MLRDLAAWVLTILAAPVGWLIDYEMRRTDWTLTYDNEPEN
jgi:hypothetical protein